jgi:hypothetical protein
MGWNETECWQTQHRDGCDERKLRESSVYVFLVILTHLHTSHSSAVSTF